MLTMIDHDAEMDAVVAQFEPAKPDSPPESPPLANRAEIQYGRPVSMAVTPQTSCKGAVHEAG
jgi:hypothetical protein